MTADDPLATLEPAFPEEEDGTLRHLDFHGRALPPLNRELRRQLHAQYRQHAPDAQWFVPLPLHPSPYFAPNRQAAPDDWPALIADVGAQGSVACALEGQMDDWLARLPARPVRPEFVAGGLTDPRGLLHVYGCSCWVLLVDRERLGGRPPPRGWSELFGPRFAGEIVLNGEAGLPATLLLLQLAAEFGPAAMEKLGRNTRALAKGSEMARTAGSLRADRPSIHVAPWFWTMNAIHRERILTVWPEEGAYTTPFVVFGNPARNRAAHLAFDHLNSQQWGHCIEDIHCISARTAHARRAIPGPLRWVGWEALRSGYSASLLADATQAFRRGHTPCS